MTLIINQLSLACKEEKICRLSPKPYTPESIISTRIHFWAQALFAPYAPAFRYRYRFRSKPFSFSFSLSFSFKTVFVFVIVFVK